MKERPILFQADMVRALKAGTKTQTRRVVKPQPPAHTHSVATYHYPDPRDHFWAYVNKAENEAEMSSWVYPCPYGQPGDRLWVRESFCPIYPQDPHYNGGRPIEYDYAATYTHGDRLGDLIGVKKKWKPSIHMPRAACRITLEIVSVRVERLQDISEADAIAEGIERVEDFFGCPCWKCYGEESDVVAPDDPIGSYRSLWESINGPGSWQANPWVWALEFKVIGP